MIKNTRGFALSGVILIAALLLIMIPSFIYLLDKDTKDTVAESKKSTALHLAEAGQDRGAWKLRESDDSYETAAAGTPITNYNFDREFTVDGEGVYKIQFTAGPNTGQVTVVTKGKPFNSEIVRSIQSIYSISETLGAMTVSGGIQWKPQLTVHWGPVITYTSIDQNPTKFFPRKYSAGQIVGRDTVNDTNNGALPSEDWVTYDYAAFYDLGVAPIVDLDYYRAKAKTSAVPELSRASGNSVADHDTSGGFDSGYYTEDIKIFNTGSGSGSPYSFANSTSVIFIEGNVGLFPNQAWLNLEAICATGNFDFNARSTPYTATIPADASDQYTHSSAAATWASSGWTNGGTDLITQTGMRGFLYVGGELTNAGGTARMVGSVFVVGDVTMNSFTLYYDSAIASNVKLSNFSIVRVSWDEIISSW